MTSVGRGMAVAVLVVVSFLAVEAVHVPAQGNTQVHFNRISKQVESIRHALEEHEKLNVRVVSQAAQAYLEECGGDGEPCDPFDEPDGTEGPGRIQKKNAKGAKGAIKPMPEGDFTMDFTGSTMKDMGSQ